MNATDVGAGGIVWESDGTTVRAFAVDHGASVGPAFGYRIDHGGRVVVLSGDTRYSEAVVAHARGADLLIHEAAMANSEVEGVARVARILGMHTRPEEAALVFRRTRPQLVVLTHLVLLGHGRHPAPTPDDALAAIRRAYDGPLTLGADLLSVAIGADAVIDQR